MGEALPGGRRIGRFALNAVAAAGPDGRMTITTIADDAGGHSAIYCHCGQPER
jgi:hypothetical protein